MGRFAIAMTHSCGLSTVTVFLAEIFEQPEKTIRGGKVTCFQTNSLSCKLLARWESGYGKPWLIVTDLNPQ